MCGTFGEINDPGSCNKPDCGDVTSFEVKILDFQAYAGSGETRSKVRRNFMDVIR